jgi:hypothetical protein
MRLRVLLFVLLLSLTACGDGDRSADVAPLSDNVTGDNAQDAVQPITANSGAAAAFDPGATAITFQLSGGIVGFCDELTVTAGGEYVLNSCKHPQTSGVLEPSDRASLKTWVSNLAGFQLRTEDAPNGADLLTTNLSFAGVGAVAAEDAQKQVVYDWANGLVARLQPKPAAAPADAAAETAGLSDGLCAEIPRPALLLLNFETPDGLRLMDPATQATCDLSLGHSPVWPDYAGQWQPLLPGQRSGRQKCDAVAVDAQRPASAT